MRDERDVYLKSLVDIRANNNELRQGFESLNHQISQLKEESKFKTGATSQLNREHLCVIANKEEIERKKKDVEEKIKKLEESIHYYQEEASNIKVLIAEANIERKKKLNIHANIISERDLLSIQLFKHQTELTKVVFQTKSLQNTIKLESKFYALSKSQMTFHYQELEKHEAQVVSLKESLKAHYPLKIEVITLRREILKAMALNTAFEKKLEKPINIHRWRKMEATDPEKYEKISKIQHLQKLLILKNDEMRAHARKIDELERELFEQKNIAQRSEKHHEMREKVNFTLLIKEKSAAIRQMVVSLRESEEAISLNQLELEGVEKKIKRKRDEYVERRFREHGQILSAQKENYQIENINKVKIL